ncbi:hypothetical protein GCM10009832_22190 [Dietzia kunjamensis subsp. schimae]
MVWSEFAQGSRPNVARSVAHWVEHYRVGLAVIGGIRLQDLVPALAWSGRNTLLGV